MQHNKGNTTTTLVVLILVIIVGFIVWYATSHKQTTDQTPAVNVNLGGTYQ